MQRTSTQTVAVGVFHDRARAQEAIQELKRQGFRDEQIGVAARHSEDLPEGHEHDGESHAGKGAGAGAAAGLGVGGLWGLGVVAGVLPAIGPVLAGGVLASLLASAAAGAAAGGLIGALVGLGIPKDEAEFYEEEFKHGGILVTVRADGRYDDARNILQRFGAYDVHSQHEDRMAATTTTGRRSATRHDGEGRMELREERLRARPETTRAGEVNVRKEVVTERETVEVPVEREEVVITRHGTSGERRSNQPIGAKEEIRVPVKEQHARAEKDTISRGEVSVEKRKIHDKEQVSADVKKERVKVDKSGTAKVRNR